MNRQLRQYLNTMGPSVVFWSIALGLYAFFRFYGIQDIGGVSISEEFAENRPFPRVLFIHMNVGLLLGILYATIDYVFKSYLAKRLAIGMELFFRLMAYFISTVFIFTITLVTVSRLYNIEIDTGRGWWRDDKAFWVQITYIVLVSFVFALINIAISRFGKGVFFNMITGRYRRPKEENFIFMFIDLKNSTGIAERLGHVQYSQFIQDCLFDLNEVVLKANASIYQYIGDEAVLLWPYEKGVIDCNCLRLYFIFQEQLQKRKEYYQDKYDILPTFKAGLHGGYLMVAEVGVVKKELAYHGDVINTAARIQGQCNTYDEHLLISGTLLNDLEIQSKYSSNFLGEIQLKGKNQSVPIYSLRDTIA